MMPLDPDSIRIEVLRSLAEQAMSDPSFRAVARHDLSAALAQFGYELTDAELAIVQRFRAVLAEAGLDLFLTGQADDDLNDLIAAVGIGNIAL